MLKRIVVVKEKYDCNTILSNMVEFDVVHELNEHQIASLQALFMNEWWSSSRTLEEVKILLAHSLSFGCVEKQTRELIAYARVVTDYSQFAFICDVIVAKEFRKQALGLHLMREITSHARLATVLKCELRCLPELVPFYTKCGFIQPTPEVITMIRKKDD